MRFIEKYQIILNNGILILQLLAYTISFLLITSSIIRSIYTYIIEYIDPNIDELTAFTDTRLDLGQSSALALSFILGVEILKLFYIKTYKQLIIVICLVTIKILISYFLLSEIEKSSSKKIYKDIY
jgi:uncharacterized membrane protein